MLIRVKKMKLNTLFNNQGAKKGKKRVGRGIGSGKGKTCGRGVKGQKARSGVAIKGFEGGQMPIIKRLPKRGFNCHTSIIYQIVTVNDIENLAKSKRLDQAKAITKVDLLEIGFFKNLSAPVKLLGGSAIKTKFTIQLDAYSESARKIIENAGGQII
jgi:large subunit ribosomal protein L15